MGLSHSKRDQQENLHEELKNSKTEINTNVANENKNERILATLSKRSKKIRFDDGTETIDTSLDNKENIQNSETQSTQSDLASIKSVDNFSDYEKTILFSTYKFIKDELNSVGVVTFMKSFETQPDLKDRFKTLKDLPIDELSKSHAMRTHSRNVMKVIDDFVNALKENNMEPVIYKLFELGERHQIYGAKKKFFEVIECQFINAIKPILLKNVKDLNMIEIISKDNAYFLEFREQPKMQDVNEKNSREICLSDEQVEIAMSIIDEKWHKVFEKIRYHMSKGVDSFRTRK